MFAAIARWQALQSCLCVSGAIIVWNGDRWVVINGLSLLVFSLKHYSVCSHISSVGPGLERDGKGNGTMRLSNSMSGGSDLYLKLITPRVEEEA